MSVAAMAGWLLVAAAGAAAVGVFRLKVRPRRVTVSSLVLWGHVLAERRDQTWWDRVRWAVSLVVTVLIAVVLAIAVARPLMRARGQGMGRTLLIVDSSLSMLAKTRDGGTRWEHAMAEVRRQAAAGGEVVLATTGQGIVEGPTTDLSLIDAALDSIHPRSSEAGQWPRLGQADAIHFFTDGALARPLSPSVVVHSVYEEAANIGITAFGARPATSEAGGAEAYLEVGNFTSRAQPARITVTRGTAVLVDRQLDLAPREVFRQVIQLGATGDPRLRAHVKAQGDALAIDDEAFGWIEEARVVDVAVVSERPSVFTALLARDRSLRVRGLKPQDYQPRGADVFIFDRWAPADPPVAPALCVAPPTVNWVGVRGETDEALPRWVPVEPHVLLAGVDPLTVDIRKVRRYQLATARVVSASDRGAPLVAVRDDALSRLVLFAFAPEDANPEVAAAFPILTGNAIEWLARPHLSEPGPPGPRLLPASTTRITAPSGKSLPLVQTGDGVVAQMETPGLYLVEVGGARSVVVVNVNAPDVSNLATTTLPSSAGPLRGLTGTGPWWVRAVWLAFVLVLAEWWTWARRITV
ncbi:MAG: hypothetical protein ABI051_18265 [Vicinamibacterales bacterium]